MSVLMSAAVSVTTTEGTFTAGSLVYVTDDGDCCDENGRPLLARIDRVEEETVSLTFIDGDECSADAPAELFSEEWIRGLGPVEFI